MTVKGGDKDGRAVRIELAGRRGTVVHIFAPCVCAYAVDYTLQHEVAHALEAYISTDVATQIGSSERQFYDRLGAVADGLCGDPRLHKYPREFDCDTYTYHSEFFAEAFNSYYCSEFTNEKIEQEFPQVYDFLEAYLEQPVWRNSSSEGAGGDLSSDIFLAVEDSDEDDALIPWISAANEIEEVAICEGDFQTCVRSEDRDLSFATQPVAQEGRRRFAGERGLRPEEGAPITVLGFAPDKDLRAAKTLRLTRR